MRLMVGAGLIILMVLEKIVAVFEQRFIGDLESDNDHRCKVEFWAPMGGTDADADPAHGDSFSRRNFRQLHSPEISSVQIRLREGALERTARCS